MGYLDLVLCIYALPLGFGIDLASLLNQLWELFVPRVTVMRALPNVLRNFREPSVKFPRTFDDSIRFLTKLRYISTMCYYFTLYSVEQCSVVFRTVHYIRIILYFAFMLAFLL